MRGTLPSHLVIGFSLLVTSVIALVSDGSHSAKKTMPLELQGHLRHAMHFTSSLSRSNNITQAHHACSLWSNLLSSGEDMSEIPQNIQAICYGLQASCLTRVGQDELAILAFDSSLELKRFLAREALQDVLLGKGYALQRLMRYDEARHVFMKCNYLEQAICAAATCSLRLGVVDWALQILKEFCHGREEEFSQALGMLGTMLFLERNRIHDTLEIDGSHFRNVISMLQKGASSSPLYSWIYHVLLKREKVESGSEISTTVASGTSHGSYLRLAEVNQSPFDDPSLIQLDDKVLLHELLDSNIGAGKVAVKTFWPRGFVLPKQTSDLKSFVEDSASPFNTGIKEWILKQRAGYGSHGNQLVSSAQAIQYGFDAQQKKSCLCQQMVEPPLLIQKRKFSIRVYVVYFMENEETRGDSLFISKKGLVKLASLPYEEGVDDRVHMTNSGREHTMSQHDFVYLQQQFEQAGWSYNDFWNDIRDCVEVVIDRYTSATASTDLRSELGKLGIPKIMGFDFLVDAKRKPWLLEVNRFPGLEARDTFDEAVKQDIVRDAWLCAAKRLRIDSKYIKTLLQDFQPEVVTTSLESI